MNQDNYGTREACQKLHDAGIALETDFYWYDNYGEYFLAPKSDYRNPMQLYPAPSMAEVWRELPEQYDGEYLALHKDEETSCGYGEYADRYSSTNPVDALIELKIWLEGQKRKK